MKNVNLNALRVFAVVASHQNFRRAADELNISRGAVSQRIKQLEIELGVALFERGARGVALTPEGEGCYGAIREALGIIDTALLSVSGKDDNVTLHLGSSTAAKWLMPRMEAFSARFPTVSLSTQVHDQMLARSLGRNEIAIWPGKANDMNPAHSSRRLTDIRLVAVCSPDFPQSDQPMTLETLLTQPLLQDAHRRWEKLIKATGHGDTHKLLNFDRSALALDAAIGGHGIAIAPSYMVQHDVQAEKLITVWLDKEPSVEGLYISWPKNHLGQLQIKRIVDWVASGFVELQTSEEPN